MRIYLDFMRPMPVELLQAGARESVIVYMEELLGNGDRSVVDRARVEAVGEKYQRLGVPRIILDCEGGAWDLQNPATRGGANWLWFQLLTGISKTYKGKKAMYGGHPDYGDFIALRSLYPLSTRDIEARWLQFNQWEQDIRPLLALLDFACPSFYGEMMHVVGGWPSTQETRREWLAQAYRISAASIRHHHGYKKPIEWFMTPYPTMPGTDTILEHTEDFLDFQLEQISAQRAPAHIWLGPVGVVPDLTPGMIGVIKGHL